MGSPSTTSSETQPLKPVLDTKQTAESDPKGAFSPFHRGLAVAYFMCALLFSLALISTLCHFLAAIFGSAPPPPSAAAPTLSLPGLQGRQHLDTGVHEKSAHRLWLQFSCHPLLWPDGVQCHRLLLRLQGPLQPQHPHCAHTARRGTMQQHRGRACRHRCASAACRGHNRVRVLCLKSSAAGAHNSKPMLANCFGLGAWSSSVKVPGPLRTPWQDSSSSRTIRSAELLPSTRIESWGGQPPRKS